MLLNIAIEQMLTDSEPELGIAVQLMGIIKILLEPENMLTEKGDFLNFFYKHSIQTLIGKSIIDVYILYNSTIISFYNMCIFSAIIAQHNWRETPDRRLSNSSAFGHCLGYSIILR